MSAVWNREGVHCKVTSMHPVEEFIVSNVDTFYQVLWPMVSSHLSV